MRSAPYDGGLLWILATSLRVVAKLGLRTTLDAVSTSLPVPFKPASDRTCRGEFGKGPGELLNCRPHSGVLLLRLRKDLVRRFVAPDVGVSPFTQDRGCVILGKG